jgi:hypothetical protein
LHLRVQEIKYAPIRLQDEGRLVVPPAFITLARAVILAGTVTGATRFSYGISLCENYSGKGDFITWLIVSHYPTTSEQGHDY